MRLVSQSAVNCALGAMSDITFDLTKQVWGEESRNCSSIGLFDAKVVFLIVCQTKYFLENVCMECTDAAVDPSYLRRR